MCFSRSNGLERTLLAGDCDGVTGEKATRDGVTCDEVTGGCLRGVDAGVVLRCCLPGVVAEENLTQVYIQVQLSIVL